MPTKDRDESGRVQDAQAEQDQSGYEEVVEGALHDVHGHVNQPPVGYRGEEAAAQHRTGRLVTKNAQQGDPLPSAGDHGSPSSR